MVHATENFYGAAAPSPQRRTRGVVVFGRQPRARPLRWVEHVDDVAFAGERHTGACPIAARARPGKAGERGVGIVAPGGRREHMLHT